MHIFQMTMSRNDVIYANFNVLVKFNFSLTIVNTVDDTNNTPPTLARREPSRRQKIISVLTSHCSLTRLTYTKRHRRRT